MTMQLNKTEYEFIVKRLDTITTQLENISDKINHMDNKTTALEEWRKYMEIRNTADLKTFSDKFIAIDTLNKRVGTLENYRWFLAGVCAIVSIALAFIISFAGDVLGS